MSYYEYELFDIVLEYAVVTVELALRLRYSVYSPAVSGRSLGLAKLLAWAKSGAPVRSEAKADMLRKFRNNAVHPGHDGFGGIAFASLPRYVFEVVNSLFAAHESPESAAKP
ncbi:MAG: hypothetical protein IPH86_12845 [bacterium]|nr:hypothetical protein [bacterium]